MTTERKRLLYLDDEEVNLNLFRAVFQGEFELTTMTNPVQAMQVIKQREFAVIVSDMKMPEMTGVDFLTQVLTLRPTTPRVLITGLGQEEEIQEAVSKGIIDVVVYKPWLRSELLDIFHSLS